MKYKIEFYKNNEKKGTEVIEDASNFIEAIRQTELYHNNADPSWWEEIWNGTLNGGVLTTPTGDYFTVNMEE